MMTGTLRDLFGAAGSGTRCMKLQVSGGQEKQTASFNGQNIVLCYLALPGYKRDYCKPCWKLTDILFALGIVG